MLVMKLIDGSKEQLHYLPFDLRRWQIQEAIEAASTEHDEIYVFRDGELVGVCLLGEKPVVKGDEGWIWT